MTEEYKLINVHVFHPAYKTVKARCEFIYCKNEKCELLKQGKCVINYQWLNMIDCPYGKFNQIEGYTKRAMKFSRWMNDKKEQYKDVLDKISIHKEKMAVVGEYVFLPYPYLNNYENPLAGMDGSFMNLQDFTINKIWEIYKFRPRALFGGEIKSFQEDTVQRFMQHLKEVFPEKYQAFINEHVEIIGEIEEKITNFVGRKAYIKTLTKGSKIQQNGKGAVFVFDGENLVCENYKPVFSPFNGSGKFIINVTDEMTVEITDNSQVCELTKFAN